MESYTIDHDFRKIHMKNTASYWILPYICRIMCFIVLSRGFINTFTTIKLFCCSKLRLSCLVSNGSKLQTPISQWQMLESEQFVSYGAAIVFSRAQQLKYIMIRFAIKMFYNTTRTLSTRKHREIMSVCYTWNISIPKNKTAMNKLRLSRNLPNGRRH